MLLFCRFVLGLWVVFKTTRGFTRDLFFNINNIKLNILSFCLKTRRALSFYSQIISTGIHEVESPVPGMTKEVKIIGKSYPDTNGLVIVRA